MVWVGVSGVSVCASSTYTSSTRILAHLVHIYTHDLVRICVHDLVHLVMNYEESSRSSRDLVLDVL